MQDYADFVLLLDTHREQLNALQISWDAFVEDEGVRAKRAVESELSRLGELSKATRNKRDHVRRRTRKQRGSIYEWSEGIHEVEATRVAHVGRACVEDVGAGTDNPALQTRQDIADLSTFIQTEWFDLSKNLHRECAIWGGSVNDRQWRLDFTEGTPFFRSRRLKAHLKPSPLGHNRMRKKLQAVVTKRPPQTSNPVSQSKLNANHSRSLGATRQDSYSASPGRSKSVV